MCLNIQKGERGLKKWTIAYVIFSVIWIAITNFWGDGHSYFGPFLFTAIFTLPSSIVLLMGFGVDWIPKDLVAPLFLLINYFVLAYIIKLMKTGVRSDD
jgi:hypothetical protein